MDNSRVISTKDNLCFLKACRRSDSRSDVPFPSNVYNSHLTHRLHGVLKSEVAKGDFVHFWSFEQHANGCI